MSNELMALWVSIVPDTSKLVNQTRRSLDGLDLTVDIDADTGKARFEIKRLDKELKKVRPYKIEIDRKQLTGAASLISKTLGGAAAGALGGLAVTGAVGGLTALTGAVLSASGALGTLPAAVAGGALAFGALKIATMGFGDALKDIGDPEKFAKAIADLSPNAKETALAIQSMMPELKALKNAVQDQFFSGFATEIRDLGTTYLPMMQDAMGRVAGSANGALRNVSELLKSSRSVADISTITGNSATGFDTLTKALMPMSQAFLDLGTVGSTFLPQLSQGVTNAANSFGQFIGKARETGQLQQWIQGGLDAMRQLGDVAGNLGGIISGVFKAGNDVGGGFLASLQTVTQTISDFVNSVEGQTALGTFFEGAKNALAALSPILKIVGESVLGTILPAFTNLGTAAAPALTAFFENLAGVMKTLAPVLVSLSGPISTILDALGPALQQTIAALAPAITPLAQAFADLMAGMAPILPVIGQLVGAVVGALAPALSVMFKALAPVISSLADALKPVLDQLAPVLAEVAMTFASAWADALQQITPMLPPLLGAVGDLLKTVIPLLPPLAEMGAAALPAIAGAIQLVLPLFTGLIKVMNPILDFIVKPLVAGFSSMADVIGTVSKALGGFASKAGDVLSKIPGIGAVFGNGGGSSDAPRGGGGGFATGGKVTGPGTGTSDSILAWLSNGEGVMTAAAMRNGGGPILTALNAGWVPPADVLHGMIPGFAQGLNPGADMLRTTIMRQWPKVGDVGGRRAEDGYGEHSSGNAIDVMIPGWDTPDGKGTGDQIAAFLAKNREALGLDGFIWRQSSHGYGGSFDTGKAMSDRGSPTQNHMDHLHVMLGKGRGAGASAVGLPTSSLTLPSGGSTGGGGGGGASMFSSGGGSGGGSGSAASAKAVREAQDRVDDRGFAVSQAQAGLDELNAKDQSKVTQKQRDAAEYRLAKAKRDQAQSVDDLTAAQENQAKSLAGGGNSGGGGSGGNAFGQDLIGGLFEGLGFDGSLFSDPRQWPFVKMFTGLFGAKGGAGGGGMQLPGMGNLFSSGDTSTVTGQNIMPGGDMGGDLIAGLGDVATNAFQQGVSQPTTVDNSINLNGNQGMDPQAVQTNIQKKQNERSRTYATAGLG